ncbi:hypothetical protein MUK42_12978 [Musa troglodytarum]|uniref:Uncharacterized protein n=1 Tax=Musa troglodytarum TaxID=320322 RepID=A0A9E7GAF9_9LILI|nr:hypothetical protein MUK42_12978 [Musa troglodytarum]
MQPDSGAGKIETRNLGSDKRENKNAMYRFRTPLFVSIPALFLRLPPFEWKKPPNGPDPLPRRSPPPPPPPRKFAACSLLIPF